MHDRETVELALYALEIGHTIREAEEIAGVAPETVENWSAGRVPHVRGVPLRLQARPAKMVPSERTGEVAPMQSPSDSERLLYEPPARGPLAGLSPDQIENLLLRAVLADLKSGRLGPGFDLEQEQVRARREIEAGDRPAPPLGHRFLEDIEELL